MNTRHKTLYVMIAIVIAVSVIFSLPKQHVGPIRVGVLTGLTGQYASIGESVRNGVLLNLEKDADVQLFFEDSGFTPTKGLSAYKKLIDVDGVDIIIGADSFTFPELVPLIHQKGLPYLQLFESSVHENDSIFQVMPFSYPLFTELAKVSSQKYGAIALVYSGSSDLFVTDADYFKKGIDQSQIAIESRLGDAPDYRSEATKVLDSGAHAFTLMMPVDQGVRFIQAIRQQKGQRKIVPVCDANIELAIDSYVRSVGSAFMQGCISINLPIDTSSVFKNAFRERFGSDPIFGADWAYDAAEMVRMLSKIPRERWTDALQHMNFQGASGQISFDETGTRFSEAALKEFQGDQFVVVSESGKAQ